MRNRRLSLQTPQSLQKANKKYNEQLHVHTYEMDQLLGMGEGRGNKLPKFTKAERDKMNSPESIG